MSCCRSVLVWHDNHMTSSLDPMTLLLDPSAFAFNASHGQARHADSFTLKTGTRTFPCICHAFYTGRRPPCHHTIPRMPGCGRGSADMVRVKTGEGLVPAFSPIRHTCHCLFSLPGGVTVHVLLCGVHHVHFPGRTGIEWRESYTKGFCKVGKGHTMRAISGAGWGTRSRAGNQKATRRGGCRSDATRMRSWALALSRQPEQSAACRASTRLTSFGVRWASPTSWRLGWGPSPCRAGGPGLPNVAATDRQRGSPVTPRQGLPEGSLLVLVKAYPRHVPVQAAVGGARVLQQRPHGLRGR